VFVGVPVEKGDVFGGDLNEARAHFRKPPRQETTSPNGQSSAFVSAVAGLARAEDFAQIGDSAGVFRQRFLGSRARSKGFGSGELSKRWALSNERSSDSRW